MTLQYYNWAIELVLYVTTVHMSIDNNSLHLIDECFITYTCGQNFPHYNLSFLFLISYFDKQTYIISTKCTFFQCIPCLFHGHEVKMKKKKKGVIQRDMCM